MESNKITVALENPIQAHGETISELQLDKPTMGLQRKLAKFTTPEEKSLAAVEILAQIPPSSVDQLSFKDFERINQALAPFLPE